MTGAVSPPDSRLRRSSRKGALRPAPHKRKRVATPTERGSQREASGRSRETTAVFADPVTRSIMSRGIVDIGPLQELLPEWTALLVSLWTQLGDVWLLAVVLAVAYWSTPTPRDDVAALIGVTVAGLGFGGLLKAVFALPRPTQPLVEGGALPSLLHPVYEATATATGSGFPSIHALLATIVYLGLARRLSVSSARRRWAAALLLVTTVSLTRVALGVHYLVDVLAGMVIGLGFLAVMDGLLPRYTTARPTVGFGLAVCFGAGTVAVDGFDPESLVLVGSALGLFAGWQLVVLGRRLRSRVGSPAAGRRPLLYRALLAAVALVPLVAAVEVFSPGSVPASAAAIGVSLVVVAILSTAWVAPQTRRVTVSVRFWALALVWGIRRGLSRVVPSGGDEGPT